MEIKSKTRTEQVLIVMHILAWVFFIGTCVETGAMIYSFFVSLFDNPVSAGNLYKGLSLSDLFRFSTLHYAGVVSFLIFISGLKAYILYLVIKIFLKINLVNPFSVDVSKLISRISHVALEIGILTLIAKGYSEWVAKRGVEMPAIHYYLDGASEFFLLGGIIFIIAQVFKRGIEIQAENDLTV